MSTQQWTVASTNRKRAKINAEPDYQRPAVWTKAQKQLLIDSILRDFDIPKFYLHKKNGIYDVIDGQQRLRTIWSYYADEFSLAKDADNIDCDGEIFVVANKKYSQLDEEVKDVIDNYCLDLVILDNKTDEEIQEMFLRLQNGTSLKAQEKRNAIPGVMRDFVKTLANNSFFDSVNFTNTRFTYDHIAAQMCLLTKNKGICNIKDRDLNDLYLHSSDFDINGETSKKITKILKYMRAMFPQKTPELKRYNVISLYILIMDLISNYDIRNRENEIAEWFIDFENNRLKEEMKPADEQDPKLAIYTEKTKNSTDGSDSLSYRYDFLKENLLNSITDLSMRDSQRSFDNAQRQVIFRKDKGICQMCGAMCEWNNWEADHVIPWSKGGKTQVDNGQVLCPACNSKKSDN